MVEKEPSKKGSDLITWEAKKLVQKGQNPPKVTITKKVKVPEAQPRFIQYHVTYEGRQGTFIVSYPLNMFKDDKEAIEHMALTELYRKNRGM